MAKPLVVGYTESDNPARPLNAAILNQIWKPYYPDGCPHKANPISRELCYVEVSEKKITGTFCPRHLPCPDQHRDSSQSHHPLRTSSPTTRLPS